MLKWVSWVILFDRGEGEQSHMSGVKKYFLIGAMCAIVFSDTAFSQDSGKENFNLGIKAQADQNYEQAVEYFQKSLETEGESPECLNNLGASLHNISQKYVNESYKYLKKSLVDNPKNEVTLELLGSLYLSQLNLVKAYEMLDALKKMESTEAESLQEKIDNVMGQVKKLETLRKGKK